MDLLKNFDKALADSGAEMKKKRAEYAAKSGLSETDKKLLGL
jgi:hypothetical protein